MTKSSVVEIKNKLSDLMVVNAARISFNKVHTELDEAKDPKLIHYLMKHNHWSPFAHPYATVKVNTADLDPCSLITHKELLAGLNIQGSDEYGNYYINGSLYAMFGLAKYIGDISFVEDLRKHCQHSVQAFIQNQAQFDLSSGYGDGTINLIRPWDSPWHDEYKVYTFHIKAPIFVARQLVKHQVGLVWNEVSRRYVSDEPEFWTPEEWRGIPKDKKQGSSEESVKENTWIVHTDYDISYRDALRFCKEWYTYNKHVCPEQRRAVLPQSTFTEWYWTGTKKAFDRVINLRCKPDAQKETKEVVDQIQEIIYE